jgi:hypothetical protein
MPNLHSWGRLGRPARDVYGIQVAKSELNRGAVRLRLTPEAPGFGQGSTSLRLEINVPDLVVA